MGRRVIFFNRFYRPDESATAQILTDLAEYLASNGWEVEVVTSRLLYSGSDSHRLPPQERLNGVLVRRLWSTGFGRGRLLGRLLDYVTIYLSFACHLLSNPRPDDVVVMKTDPPLLSILGWLAGQVRAFKLVSWCQDLFPEVAVYGLKPSKPLAVLFRLLSGLRNLSLNGSACVAVLSADMEKYLKSQGVHSPICKLPNWALEATGGIETTATILRNQWGLDSRVVLGYSGNLGRVHDWSTILGALPELESIDGLTVLFIGGGAGYEKVSEHRGTTDSGLCRFLPYQPKEILEESLKVPDIHWFSLVPEMSPFVYPSKFYGILQSGRPVIFIGSPKTEIAEFIERYRCGIVVPPGDRAGLVTAVRRLVSDPSLRACMGKAALELSRSETSRLRSLERWDGALRKFSKRGN